MSISSATIVLASALKAVSSGCLPVGERLRIWSISMGCTVNEPDLDLLDPWGEEMVS
eukprot:CAMPEP_0173169980 /NCGR_PEP_ID=MMETSP1141-20130122/995_1 /TAXON_ID=483371 /ORGANISM="non described non described, Strain CCMP2298" /LENGTH=56 /DNA_ID=CAMNT_0014091847 /DNA_START=78 /DNA_END=245 /DNA_ORIENTATION=+